MSNILPFAPKKKPSRNLMCRNNHHKWVVVKDTQFDVKEGKLVTLERCERCAKTRRKLS